MIIVNDVRSRDLDEVEELVLNAIPTDADAFVLYDRDYRKIEVTLDNAEEAPIVEVLTAADFDVDVI